MQFYEILAPIKDDMESMEAELRRILESDVQLVKSVSDYLLESRGKRIRPALLILSSQACGHKGDDVIKTAAVVELAHTATLVHDDLIDHSDLRRGRPTVHRRWNEEISVIMGDWIFTSVFAYLIDNISRGLNDILHVLIQAIVKMCRAEMVELQNRFYLDFPEPEYLGMVGDKTAGLISAAAEMGTILADNGCRAKFSYFGSNLGMAFQLADGLLDCTGGEKVMGKPVGSDLKEGKITLPLISAFRNAPDHVSREIRDLISRNKDGYRGDGWEDIKSFVVNYGGIEYTRRKLISYADKARSSLAEIPSSKARNCLEQVVDFVINRQS